MPLSPTVAEFRRALVQPSAPALLAALLTAGLALGSFVATATADLLRSPAARYLSGGALDFDLVATRRALQLQQADPLRPALVMLGTSQLAVALPLDRLATALAAAGVQADLYKLATPAQSLLDALVLAESVPEGTGGVLVLGLSPAGFATPPQGEGRYRMRLGLRAQVQDQELARLGTPPRAQTGLYAIDNLEFLLARRGPLLRNVLRRAPQEPNDWDLSAQTPLTQEVIRIGVPTYLGRLAPYWQHAPAHHELLQRLLRRVAQRTRLSVLLVETPVNPLLLQQPAMQEAMQDHRGRIAAIAAAHGADYLDLNLAAGYTAQDFRDWNHIATASAIGDACRLVAARVAARAPPPTQETRP